MNKYYKMVGFWKEGGVHESFVSINVIQPATSINPNTGHVLINTFVSSYWEA